MSPLHQQFSSAGLSVMLTSCFGIPLETSFQTRLGQTMGERRYMIVIWCASPKDKSLYAYGDPRAGWRVGEKPSTGTKEQRRSEESSDHGRWVKFVRIGLGLVGLKRDYGPATQGPLLSKGLYWLQMGFGPKDGNGVHPSVVRRRLVESRCRLSSVPWQRERSWMKPSVWVLFKSKGWGILSLFFFSFGRTPERSLRPLWGFKGEPPERKHDRTCSYRGGYSEKRGLLDLIAINCDALEVQNPEWTPATSGPQVQRSEKETNWEQSSLAKFSKLGGEILDWRTLEVVGAAGGVLICWDKRALELLEWEEGQLNLEQSEQCDSEEIISAYIRSFSNHNRGGGKRRGPSPFRFENMWLKVEGFKDLLRSWWQGMSVFGNLESNKLAALQQVDYWDQVESERRLSEEEFSRKKEAKEGYAKWVKLEEIHWRQLSRELWLREGNKNTGYRGLNLNQISQQEADILELPFMEEEVHSALMDMNGDKAPGPDGFTGAFWQFCWEFVKGEVLEMFKEFHEHNTFLKSLNATIKNVIGRVISSDQNAFVMGRQILDASLIANEVIDSWKKEGKKVEGVDMELHIDCQVLSISKWEPAGFFPSSKGLRQGDPLSPYLFIMGMEVLSALIRRAVEGGCITGCRIQRVGGRLWTLCWFEAASGLRINLAKSEIIPVGEVNEILEMAVDWDARLEKAPKSGFGRTLGVGCGAGPEIPQLFNVAAQKSATVGFMGPECWPRRLEPKESKNYLGGGLGLMEGGKKWGSLTQGCVWAVDQP
ncbi:putative mitochondrial protein [Vitis vinifera]|uniref:Putative mitochondrial protein n=1 Tax=Vitis vinifera TaxID=29760 RepID=A0A438CGT5_VITVI|nr:putative mitochondrial protein [Vitis vinifera]